MNFKQIAHHCLFLLKFLLKSLLDLHPSALQSDFSHIIDNTYLIFVFPFIKKLQKYGGPARVSAKNFWHKGFVMTHTPLVQVRPCSTNVFWRLGFGMSYIDSGFKSFFEVHFVVVLSCLITSANQGDALFFSLISIFF